MQVVRRGEGGEGEEETQSDEGRKHEGGGKREMGESAKTLMVGWGEGRRGRRHGGRAR